MRPQKKKKEEEKEEGKCKKKQILLERPVFMKPQSSAFTDGRGESTLFLH